MFSKKNPPGIPIFIISFNKRDQLLRSLASYRKLSGVGDIVIHDNGSDNPRTVEMLKELEVAGRALIYRSAKITNAEGLNSVQDSIADYFNTHLQSNYVVTDPDVELKSTKNDILEVMTNLLSGNSDVVCVGPMLTIDDIPDSYPQKDLAVERHIEQFWKNKPEAVQYKDREVFVQRCGIDTTFAMYRAGSSFSRLNSGLRLYSPYQAKHLDWYEPDGDTDYFAANTTDVSHWSQHSSHQVLNKNTHDSKTTKRQIYFISNGEIHKKEI